MAKNKFGGKKSFWFSTETASFNKIKTTPFDFELLTFCVCRKMKNKRRNVGTEIVQIKTKVLKCHIWQVVFCRIFPPNNKRGGNLHIFAKCFSISEWVCSTKAAMHSAKLVSLLYALMSCILSSIYLKIPMTRSWLGISSRKFCSCALTG